MPAFLGQYCVKDEQCHLSDFNSNCHFIVRGVYGRCRCAFGSGSDGKCSPGEGGECREDAECRGTHPQASCKGGTCQCPDGRCTDVAALPVKIRPVSLGKPCLSHSQCQARDQNSRCEGGRCECVIDTPTCSSVNTRCLNDTFQCTSGQCISWYFVCDGEKNCLDGTDEENCTPFACPVEAFQCNDGTCLSRSAVCNGRWECPDGSDEARCYTGIPCDVHSFRCASGQCVPAYAFCNAVVDCLDGSDENFAACERGESCPEDSFRCGNGRCRSSAILCSGLDGCGDNTDEDRCNVCHCKAPE
ncbi:low-density lipoprotein receptor-related protein [Trichonephila clavata]|uniref:Low-density lipoprotein receptor-related protein n=1 Tax=Trichonephila clavata TaxID=2740835 RepID=A0A8X6M3K6_TRICU|nr:low-density lipoprotein receptor-related protein [Trichonephila clavata]